MDLSWLVPIVAPILPVAVERVSGLVTERLPSGARDLVPIAIGAGLGVAGHALGMSPEEAAALAGIGGVGAVGYHRLRARKRVTVESHPGRDSHQVAPSSLPPK